MYAKMFEGLSSTESRQAAESEEKEVTSWFSWGKVLLVLGAVGALIGIWWTRSS
jgi:hypothetical protein